MRDDLDDIRKGLEGRAQEVALALYPHAVSHKGNLYPNWVSPKDPGSFVIHPRSHKGQAPGTWFHNSQGVGGSILNLIAYSLTGQSKCRGADFIKVLDWAREFLGISDRPAQVSDEDRARIQRQNDERMKSRAAREMNEAERKAWIRKTALSMWAEARPILGTVAEDYLDFRGIDVERMDSCRIAFIRSARCEETGDNHPVMLSLVTDRDDKPIAVHRTFLVINGRGKAVFKAALGDTKGGAVRFGGVAERISVCEGIETGASIYEMLLWDCPVWCFLGTAGIKAPMLPPLVRSVSFYPDGDRPSTFADGKAKQRPLAVGQVRTGAGISACVAGRSFLIDQGIKTFLMPEPRPGLDYNDIHKANKRSAG